MAKKSNQRPPSFRELDQIVAVYAPIGAQRRRQRNKRRALAGGALLATCASVILLAQSDLQLRERFAGSAVSGVSGLSASDLAQLKLERAAFNEKFDELARQLDLVKTQKTQLEAQQSALAEESRRFAALLENADAQQLTPGDDQAQGLKLEEEIAAMAAQRQALGERWQQFEAQGELLAMEIIAVNAQRKELEKQRGLIERQRQELSRLLEQAEELYRRNMSAAGGAAAPTDETTSLTKFEEEAFVAAADSMMVQNAELDTMRGGYRVGEGLDISFGFQQSGAVNGVEQYKNSFSIGSVASGFSNVDMSNMKSVVLQNGAGNLVGANVFDALSDTFGNVIQNTLDDQVISTTTIYDISLHNMPDALQGLAGEQALLDALGSF